MEREPTNRRMLLWTIVGALAAWGLLLGLGSFLGIDPATPDHDIRRMAMVTGSVAVFLAIWLGLLWLRGRR
jgi:membrane protein DedA with SNARE-associated domain